jgi:hypothetical protein
MVDNIGFFGGTTHCAPIACSMAFAVATDDALVHRYRLLCYTYLQSIPDIMGNAYALAQKEWEKGFTGVVTQATYQVIDAAVLPEDRPASRP